MCNDIMTFNEAAFFITMLFFFGASCVLVGMEFADHRRKKQLRDDNTIIKWTDITDASESKKSKQIDLPL